jgi:hypothetical protein
MLLMIQEFQHGDCSKPRDMGNYLVLNMQGSRISVNNEITRISVQTFCCAPSHSDRNRLLASLCPSVHLSVCPNVSARLPLDRFS